MGGPGEGSSRTRLTEKRLNKKEEEEEEEEGEEEEPPAPRMPGV